MKKTLTFQTLEKTKKEDDTFSDLKGLEYHLPAPWKLLGSTVIDQDTPVPKTGLNLKGKPGQFGISEQLLCVKVLEGDLGQKHSQLFWGLPSLHSESIVATLLVPLNSYSLEPEFVLFNGVCKAATAPILDHGSPALPQPRTLPLTFVHPQPFPNIEPQPPTLPFAQVHPQAHMQSPLPPVQLSPLPCGSTLQIPQSRTVPGVFGGNEQLQSHLLQNHQAGLWDLVPGYQPYETAFGLLIPGFPLVSQPSQDYASIPSTGHFHFSSELQDNLGPYGPNNPTPLWHYQPCSRTGVLEAMGPQYKPTGTPPHSCKRAHPQHSVHWGQSSSDLRTEEPSHSESFCESFSMKPQLRKDVAKNLGQILGKCPLDNPQMISGCYVLNSLRVVPETEEKWVCHSRIDLKKERLSISRKSLDQRQARSALRLHVSSKLWQITMGRIPTKVCCSWLAEDVPLWNSPLGNTYCNTAIPKIPFLDHKTQKMLEAHLIRFRVSQKWGLPLKVIESIKFYMLREAKTWPFPQSDVPSSSNSISGMDLKSNFSHPLRGSSSLFHRDKIEAANSASITVHRLPLTVSHADRGGEGSPRQSLSSTGYEVPETVQTTESADGYSGVDSMSLNGAELQSRPSQEQPSQEQVAASEPENEVTSSSSHLETTGGKQRLEKNLKHVLTPSILREIFRAPEVRVLLSGSDASGELGSSTEKNKDSNKTTSVLIADHSPSRISIPEDLTVWDFKKQLFTELKFKLENQAQSQTEGYESDVSFTSDSLTGYLPSSSNSVSSGDASVFKDFHTHLCNAGVSLDPRQEPGFFKRILRNLTPAEKILALSVPRKESGRSETPGLGTSKTGKSQPIKGKSDKKPHPPESYFRKKIGQFFQLLYSSKDSTRHRSEKDRALFRSCGPPEAHELMASLGKLLEDKLLCGQKSEFLEWSRRKSLQAQPKPTKGQPSNRGATYAQHGEAKSNCYCHQTAVSPGLSRVLSPGQRHPRVSFEQRPQFWDYSPTPESRDP
ncbi:iron-sulfur cluster assembly 1 homolog, mitochondrial isoform X1 [Peromyscus californicus insignis]|uniref:iron-sulfur cluster assembly 1 homolog, mitochondrial isoform X1 n=1 Tax=Peromyscus californicus insignis TaxID=564181 RepID=UPI0022A6FA73|nr:iron-sulfur cluster assembly 1 homolog, mitochondrial isoform X1 [Peromyscus californicus insignis]XP_052584015.1 iron-sulfur cluster assembly 1 homolog, mitochondrial isoform X1 [Peromyscus californicus insignis]XP_052584016.1 iron-sulfur cluster assembly 1 homolog, mitochondrial isoform X1 [Peromyscus californicus insignis]XP_052584017.1 iron-sulfur cluster assembly 1 homolog, mitochondrial isoform X1 [Peromyscus californicus insignis]XP_052584018.1 iron-sulfur cluster assembly 1 homolog, 